MDPLSDITNPVGKALHYLKLTSVFYCRSEAYGKFCIEMPVIPDTAMFHIVTQGQLKIRCEQEVIEATRGDLILIPKGLGHLMGDERSEVLQLFDLPRKQISPCYETLTLGDESSSEEKTLILCGVVRIEHPAGQLLIESLPNIIHFKSSNTPYGSWLDQTVRLISEEASNIQLGGEAVLTRLADVLVIQALREWVRQTQDQSKGWIAALSDKKIGRALLLLHTSPEKDWTIEKIAQDIGMSRTNLANQFSNLVGDSVIQYLTKWRMNLAVMRLQEGERFSAKMMNQLGYQSESSFRRAFKKTTGKNIGDITRVAKLVNSFE